MNIGIIFAGWTAVTPMAEQAPHMWVQPCWNVGTLSAEAIQSAAKLSFDVGSGGKPDADTVQMLAWDGHSEAAARQVYETARRAIIRCGQDVAVGQEGQTIVMTFDPRTMKVEQVNE